MSVRIKNSLALPHQGENESLNKIIRGSIRRKGLTATPTCIPLVPAWDASFFLLDKCELFNTAHIELQTQILASCSNFILSESYFIEKAGMAYCAKMILLGESTEIRQMYGLIASDEAVHLQWLTPYVPESLRTTPQGNFISFVTQMIDECDVNTLYYLVQTVLEGWGIAYYKTLSAYCQLPCLKNTLKNIVKDEALHHKTGVALFDPNKMDSHSQNLLVDGIKKYADILRMGPLDIVNCIELNQGELSHTQLTKIFENLQTQQTSAIKLDVLKSIMNQPFIEKTLKQLEDLNFFMPYTPLECAKYYRQQKGGSFVATSRMNENIIDQRY